MVSTVETQPIQPSFFQQVGNMLLKYWAWALVVFFALIIGVTIYILVKKIKGRTDPFKDYYKKVQRMCKFHKDPVIKDIYMISDNGLIYLGKYLGEAITYDGYRNILLWKFKKWYLFWFPKKFDYFDIAKETFIVRCNMNKKYTVMEADQFSKEVKEMVMDLATDMLIRNGTTITIKGLGLERVNYFLYPILRDKNGNIIDKSLEVFDRERTPAIINTLYTLSEDFANISRELVNWNPNVRIHSKTGEMPQGKKE